MSAKPSVIHDLLITAIETNSHHGVGILLQRFFPDSTDFACIRTTSLYNGEEPFGSAHHELCSRFLSLAETEAHLRQILGLYQVRRILCVPYYREECVHALLAQRITGAPLCTYLMDDQNIYVPRLPDHVIGDLIAASDLCLGISPEMCAAYRRKFNRDIYLLPPVLGQSVPLVPCYWQPEPGEVLRVAMIGNVWTAGRFSQLRELLRSSGLHLDWFGNGPNASWLYGTPDEWEADHIRCMGYYPEEDLVAALASYPIIVVPSGGLDSEDDNPAFSRLSLPSRLVFLHATLDTPVLVLGSEDTAAGRFVRRLGTGLCSNYDQASLQAAIKRLLDPGFRPQLQSNIRRWSQAFAFPNAGQWIWDSLEAHQGQPAPFLAAFPPNGLGEKWLSEIAPAQPRPIRILPQPNESFRDEHASSFGFLRTGHLPALTSGDLTLPTTDRIELSVFQAAAVNYILCGALPQGGDVLFLGATLPPNIAKLGLTFRLWQIRDLEAWQKSGYAGDHRHVVDAVTGAEYPPEFPQFDAICSIGWCNQLPANPHPLEGFSLYLEACTRPGGVNLHFFTAVLHPAYFWTGPAHGYLQNRFLGEGDWPILDELLSTEDIFTMSESAYELNWRPTTVKSYADFGRPLSLGLFWRKP